MNREKASGAACPRCGSELEHVAQQDGSVASLPCGACHGRQEPAEAPTEPNLDGAGDPDDDEGDDEDE